ncbi:MAG: NAD-dependent epimerase/dehydratase family protein [Proteobacteria bacterium]|nr:NAD-dependent epimerase/dehydratase family protein [Pseudomonadota bacterium]
MTPRRILVTGAVGQVGADLTPVLRARFGAENVVATGHRTLPSEELRGSGPFETVDVTDKAALADTIERHGIDTICHLATLLSASGEKHPDVAWSVNIGGLKNVLDLAVENALSQVFWPSSIAVFGPTTPREMTPQRTVLEPNTMYGVTKLAGENLCNYYFHRYGLDVRSIRYPGLLSYKTFSGGGTTDYAVEIFFEANRRGTYRCFVRPDTILPLLYMDEAIHGTMQLMEAEAARISVRTSYNMGGLSFSAEALAREVGKHVAGFTCTFVPDFRQAIADSWPRSVDDSIARHDWGWKPSIDLPALTKLMLAGAR